MEESLLFENIMQALYDYGEEVSNLYKQRLLMDDKKATGNLINSIETRVAYTSMGLEYVVYLQLEDYWKYVEKGRKAGKFPPVNKILEWIRVKPVVPRPMSNGKLPTDKQLAYLIGRKIATKGVEAGNQLKESVDAINRHYLPILEEALQKDWEVYSISILKDINRFVKI